MHQITKALAGLKPEWLVTAEWDTDLLWMVIAKSAAVTDNYFFFVGIGYKLCAIDRKDQTFTNEINK